MYCHPVRNVVAIAVYLIAVFAGAALMAPFAWKAVFADWAFLTFLQDHDDFHRYFNRCLMLLAIGGLVVLWRLMKIESWKELGWVKFRGNGPFLSQGLLMGIASLAAVAALALFFDAREINNNLTVSKWVKHLLNTLGAAIAVGVLEETIFRGMLFNLLRRDLNWKIAAGISAVIFASVHFMDQRPNIQEITWTTGFTAFPQFIHDFANDPYWPAYFVNLILAGLILAASMYQSGNIYYAIGIHAGWIIALKTNGFLTHPTGSSIWWGADKTNDAWMATPLLLGIAWYMLTRDDPASDPKDA